MVKIAAVYLAELVFFCPALAFVIHLFYPWVKSADYCYLWVMVLLSWLIWVMSLRQCRTPASTAMVYEMPSGPLL